MRFLTVICAGLFVFGGAGFAMPQDAYASAPKEEGGPQIQFVELDPLILPIVDKSGVSQTVSLVVSLEVADMAAADKVKMMEPKLKDAFIQDLYGMLNEHAALKGGVIQVGYIKKRLSAISHEVMGDHVVNDVLLQVVQQRRM